MRDLLTILIRVLESTESRLRSGSHGVREPPVDDSGRHRGGPRDSVHDVHYVSTDSMGVSGVP